MNEPKRIGRREALKWITTVTGIIWTMDSTMLQATSNKGYGNDPDLKNHSIKWPRTFSKEQLQTINAICDVIIPEDNISPSASQVGVGDFIDEWISAPYPNFQKDRNLILDGINWFNTMAQKQFGTRFELLSVEQQTQICDVICCLPKAACGFKQQAQFFTKIRYLTMGAFYTTEEGMKDVQYLGNEPLSEFKAPPDNVLKHVGL